MANDIDVKIGITTQGDASGAKAVDKALDEVKQSAQEAASAAGDAAAQAAEKAAQAADKATTEVKELASEMAKDPGTGGLSDAIGDLDAKTTSLSDDKKKAAVNGFAAALQGLASGDLAGGMRGVAESLFQMAGAIPVPGAAIAFSLALTGVAAAWKAFGPAAADAGRSVNEFGETLDEEMARLEAWADSQINWDNIKAANASLRADFDLVKSTAESTQRAIESLFEARIASQVAGLRGEAEKAAAAGDTSRATDLRAQAEQLKQYEELVKLNVSLTAAKSDLDALRVQADSQAQSYRSIEEATRQSAERLEALKQQIVDRTGNIDATVPGSKESIDLLKQAEKELARLQSMERSLSLLESIASRDAEMAARATGAAGAPRDLVSQLESVARASREQLEGAQRLLEKLPDLEKFASDLRNLDQITNDAADKEAALAKERETSNESAVKLAQEMSDASIQIDLLQAQLKDLATAAGPDQAARAAEQAQLMTSQMADSMEAMAELSIDNAEKIKAVADAAASGAKAVSSDLDTARGAYELSAKQMGEAIGKIEKATEGVGEEASAAGEEIKQGSQDFRSKVGEATNNFTQAAFDLTSTALGVARQAADLAAEQRRVAAEVAVLRQQTNAALADAGLALSQIRNMG